MTEYQRQQFFESIEWRTFRNKVIAAFNTRLQRTRHERASLLSCVGEPLKCIYKASQEKKERTSPWVPNGFYRTAPGLDVSET